MNRYNETTPTNRDIEHIVRLFKDKYGSRLTPEMETDLRFGLMFVDQQAYSNGYEQGKAERPHQCEVIHIRREV